MLSPRKLTMFYSGMVFSAGVFADETPVSPRLTGKVVSSPDILHWMLPLLVVLAIFGGLVWLMRKSGVLTLAGRNELAIVAGLSLGMREKLVLVKVGEKQLLLGVTAGRIDKLLELEGEQRLFLNQGHRNENGSFQDQLMRIMRQENGDV